MTAASVLERDREVAELETLLDDIRGPGARLALIEGPPGIGKTTLMAAARRGAADRGIRTLTARGSELEREFPFGVVRQLFEPSLAEPAVRAAALEGAAAGAAPIFDGPATGVADHGDLSFSTLHGLFWLTLNLAGDEPLLLVIDDLHWVDRPSLRFLAYLVRRLEDVPVLACAALRPREPGADLALIGELAADPLSVAIEPVPLSRAAVETLLAERLGAAPDAAFCTACHTATGGNPLLLSELVRALRVERIEPVAANVDTVRELGPRAASRAVVLRLARLGPDAADVARALAVLGDGAELRAVADHAGLDAAAAGTAIGALVHAEIVRPDGGLGFVHPLVRDAVYLELPPGRRELEHQRAAQLLHEAGASAEQVAAHLLHTPRGAAPWAARVLEAAGRASALTGAPESAVALLRRALDEDLAPERRGDVLEELGHQEVHVSGPDATTHLTEAYELVHDPGRRARIAFNLARTFLFTRQPEAARATAQRARDEAPAALVDERQALEALDLMGTLFGGGDPSDTRRLTHHRGDLAGPGIGARMLAALSALHWTMSDGTAEACGALARRAMDDGQLLERDHGLFWVAANRVFVYAEDEYVMGVWDEAIRSSHRSGSQFSALAVSLWRGFTLLNWGDLPGAEASLAHAARDFRMWSVGAPTVTEYPAAFLAATRLERGDLAGARAALDASPIADLVSDGADLHRHAGVQVLLAEGRPEAALALWEELVALQPPLNPIVHLPGVLRARVLTALGREDEALEALERDLGAARRWGAPGALGKVLALKGTLVRGAAGLALLEEAVPLTARSPRRLEHARAACALGTALRHERRPADARGPLREALELAEACGAAPLVERARSELHAAGARPRTTARGGVGALTPSERRVAGLAASGMSNRTIAQELFVTPKTVEVHLSSAYRKLDISGRRDLAGALG